MLPERLEVLPILILAFNPHSPPRHKWATSSIFQAATGCGAQNFHIAIWGQPLPTRMFLFLKQDHSMAPPLRDMSSPGLIKPTSAIRWPSSLSLDIRLSGALSTLVPVLLCRKHNPALTASSVLPTSTAFIPISRARPTVLPVLPGCLAAPRSSAQHILRPFLVPGFQLHLRRDVGSNDRLFRAIFQLQLRLYGRRHIKRHLFRESDYTIGSALD